MGTLRAHAGLAFPSSPLTAGAGQRSECSVFTFEQVTLTACVEPRTRVRGLEVRARGREVRGVLRRQRPSHRRVFPRRPRFDLVSPISVSAASQFLLERKKLVLRQLRAGAAQRSYARCCFFFLFFRRPHVVLQRSSDFCSSQQQVAGVSPRIFAGKQNKHAWFLRNTRRKMCNCCLWP